MPVANVLIGSSDDTLAAVLRFDLESEGFSVGNLDNSDELFKILGQSRSYDCVLIDQSRDFEDIPFIVKAIRQRNRAVSIVAIISKSDVPFVCGCYDSGAINCLLKPLSLPILISVMKSAVRFPSNSSIEHIDLSYDVNSRQFRRGDRVMSLTETEHDILFNMIRRPERILTRGNIQQLLSVSENTVEKHVSNLRAKLCAAGERDLIFTVRGQGYRLLYRDEVASTKNHRLGSSITSCESSSAPELKSAMPRSE